MKKRRLPLLLALVLCLSLSVPALAAEKTLSLKEDRNDTTESVMKEVSPSEAVFILSGDVSHNGPAKTGGKTVPMLVSNGSLDIRIQI